MSERADRLSELLPEAGIDLLVVTDLVNVRYLTGYTGSNGIALVGPDTRQFLTDFRYLEQAAEEVDPSFDRLRATLDLLSALTELLPSGATRLGFEEEHVSVRQNSSMRDRVPGNVELVGVHGLVERLRSIKDCDELARIRSATELADAAFGQLLSGGIIGRTEQELALALEFEMRRRGAEQVSFDLIVAAGPHGALPHASPRNVRIKRGDLVVFDWGARLDGYCSDCTRTVAAGEPPAEAVAVYDLVLEAQLTGLREVQAGAICREVDATVRELIAGRGHGEHFGHGLGHGVGLDIHEAPRLSQTSDGELAAGNVVTVEPGVYLPGKFGVRIEDLVVVTASGCDILTGVPKEMIVSE